ncbi:MAG: class I SAM-dependent methyltransferase, partial [Stellaceae bacterium]
MTCPICGAAAVERFRSAFVSVLKCGGCSHLYAEHPAPGQGVQALGDPECARREFDERNRRLVRYWRRHGFLADGARVLDIGAGAGHVVEAIAAQLPAARIACVEADPGARRHLAARGFAVAESVANLDARRFDAILLIEAIEHVDAPVALLRTCRGLLAADGRLFLTTPCGETASGARPAGAYATREHVQFFTERSLRAACAAAGFARLDFAAADIMRPRGHGLRRAVALGKALARPFRD